MKPFGAAERASDRSTLVVWYSQPVTAAGAGKYCQRFLRPPLSGIGELLKAFQTSTQEHPQFTGNVGTNVT